MRSIFLAVALLWQLCATAQIKSANLTASGLTCSMCSKSIFKALEKVPFIEKLDVNIETSTYSMTFKKDMPVVLDQVKKAVQDAGFSVAKLEITAHVASQEVTNDSHVTIDQSTFHFVNVPKKTIDGDITLRLLDKNYLTLAEHKKYKKYTTMKCYETGVMTSCCPKNNASVQRIYHVTF